MSTRLTLDRLLKPVRTSAPDEPNPAAAETGAPGFVFLDMVVHGR
jgi:hypothetical protein